MFSLNLVAQLLVSQYLFQEHGSSLLTENMNRSKTKLVDDNYSEWQSLTFSLFVKFVARHKDSNRSVDMRIKFEQLSRSASCISTSSIFRSTQNFWVLINLNQRATPDVNHLREASSKTGIAETQPTQPLEQLLSKCDTLHLLRP